MLRPNADFDRLSEEGAFAVLARATALQREGRDIINLGIGQPDFPTPQHIVEAAIRALRDGHHGYTPTAGILPLREAVSRSYNRRFGVEVSPDRLLIVPGGKFTIFMAISLLGARGAEVIYPDPGFPIYRSMIEFTGATPVALPIREKHGFAFSAQEALALVTARTRLVIINSPANPTGGVTPKTEFDALVAGLEHHPDTAILSDEIYASLIYDGERHVSLLSYPSIRDRLIHLDGASKSYAMTGWRLGWSVWPAKLYDAAHKLAVNSYSCVNAAAQWAGIAALDGPQDGVAAMVAELDRRRQIAVDGLNSLPGISCIAPKGAFYAFPNISRTGWEGKALATELLEQVGVAVLEGSDFGVHGEPFLRISYANTPENIRCAIGRMSGFLCRRR